MLVCTAEQMRELDRATIEDVGVAGIVLMEVAGRGVVDVIAGQQGDLRGTRVAVLCGSGNNGGDGYVVARHLMGRGAEVITYLVADRGRIRGDALVNLEVLERLGGRIVALQTDEQLEEARFDLVHAQVLVDALLGTGLSSEVRGQYRKVLERVNRCTGLKVAVDIPSGLHADTGEVLGVAFDADHTVTLGYAKVGLVSHPGALRCGKLHVVDIGIPPALEASKPFSARVLSGELVGSWLEHRPCWGHKGTYGHLLVIAGSAGKTGAAVLCGEAALRSGAGLTTVASPADAMAAMESKTREVMLAPLTPDGRDPDDSDEVFAHLMGLMEGKTAVALGPGIPRCEGMTALVGRLVRECPLPLVIDADGLNDLASRLDVLGRARAPVALTPHPGEMSRLCGLSTQEVQADRLRVARDFARAHGVCVALKGFRTVIATPDDRAYINPTGNSGMGSGGTGDVLTGVIGGFLAQRHEPLDALALGVYVHGLAGDRAAARLGERGLLASDVLDELGGVLKGWEQGDKKTSIITRL